MYRTFQDESSEVCQTSDESINAVAIMNSHLRAISVLLMVW